jgi:hypothetical protein
MIFIGRNNLSEGYSHRRSTPGMIGRRGTDGIGRKPELAQAFFPREALHESLLAHLTGSLIPLLIVLFKEEFQSAP